MPKRIPKEIKQQIRKEFTEMYVHKRMRVKEIDRILLPKFNIAISTRRTLISTQEARLFYAKILPPE